jgi:pyridoxal 5'-phosphate synthase pdxT subunit
LAKIGVLALQGDYQKHVQVIASLGHNPILVKTEETLKQSERLIIPGGESTTFLKLIDRLELRKPLTKYCKNNPVFGTCAGLIILATEVVNASFETLKCIDLKVERNAYGRQIDSFIDDIKLPAPGGDPTVGGLGMNFEAVFIRAPKIVECLKDTKALAWHNKDVVMASQGNILVATFHPELTADSRIHDYFINTF